MALPYSNFSNSSAGAPSSSHLKLVIKPRGGSVENVMGTVYKVITQKDIENNKSLNFLRYAGSYAFNSMEDNFEDEEMNLKSLENPNVGPRKQDKNKFFNIKTSDDQPRLCCSREHFPVRNNDAIFGRVKLVTIKGGQYYEFIERPLGLAGIGDKAFYDNLASFSRGKITGNIANNVYQSLIRQYRERWDRKQTNSDAVIESNEIDMVFKQMSYLSESYRFFPSTDLDNILEGVSGSMLKTILQRWYWYFLRRRLELLGLSRSDIGKLVELGYNMRRIYRLIMKDAFTILPLSLSEAIRLKNLLNQPFTDDDMQAAQAARVVYHHVVEKKWSGVPDTMVGNHLDKMISTYGMIHDLRTVYFPSYYNKECLVSSRIKRSMQLEVLQEELLYNSSTIKLTEEQKQAIDFCLDNPVSIIKGGAGVGKTAIIELMAENLERLNVPYAIVAFTGKAVCRIEENVKSSNKPMTIHRLCYGGWNEKELFRHLIIDEVSMVTIGLLAMIYERYSHDFAITFVGDEKQLEPIEWGCLFNEILYWDIPVFTLTKNLRLKGDPANDGIFINSIKIGEIIDTDRQLKKYQRDLRANADILVNIDEIRNRASFLRDSFVFQPRDNFELVAGGFSEIKTRLLKLIDQGTSSTDVVIITPFNRHLQGLNNIAQECFIVPGTPSISHMGVIYYKGDIVRMTTNDYNVEVFTGTTGILTDFDEIENPYRPSSRNFSWNRSSNIIKSGYMQVKFITHKIRRFFINEIDYKMYVWANAVANGSKIINASAPEEFLPVNSDQEWQTIFDTLNSISHYYHLYPDSPKNFMMSPGYEQPEVKRLFNPLLKIKYPYGSAKDLTLSYAMTVHSSEGSDWKVVFGYCGPNDKRSSFLNYNLLYTLITRAKENVYLVGNHNLFHNSALQSPEERYDNLSIRLESTSDTNY